MARTWTYRRALLLTWGLVLMILMGVVWLVEGGRSVRWPIWAWVLVVGVTLIGLGVCVVSALVDDDRVGRLVGQPHDAGSHPEASLVVVVAAAPVYWLGKLLAGLWGRVGHA